MTNVITILENYLYACKKVDGDRVIYYLKGVKHYASGKTFRFVQFIEKVDYEEFEKQFKQK